MALGLNFAKSCMSALSRVVACALWSFCESFGEIPRRKDRIGVFSEKIYPFVEQSALVAVEVHI